MIRENFSVRFRQFDVQSDWFIDQQICHWMSERERERERERDEGEISIKHVEIVFMFSWNFIVFLWAYIISYISLLNCYESMANIQKVESSAASGKGYLVYVFVLKLKRIFLCCFSSKGKMNDSKKKVNFIHLYSSWNSLCVEGY